MGEGMRRCSACGLCDGAHEVDCLAVRRAAREKLQAACGHRSETMTRTTGDPPGPWCCGRCGLELPSHSAPARFRVLVGQSQLPREVRDRWPLSVPWSFVERFRERAEDNHDQTLERLNERGGLSPEELWRAAHDQPLFRATIPIPTEEQCGEWLIQAAAEAGSR